jgi:DNA polymerase I
VQTVWGRRRYIPAIYEKNKTLYEEACRVAINTVAQGTAAEIMKKGMLNVEFAFKDAGVEAQMLLQIHDELLISVNTQQCTQAELLIKEVLESVVDWPVPLSVTTRSGADWREVSK